MIARQRGIMAGMGLQSHWERVYESKAPREMSWHRPHLETSIEWVVQAAPDRAPGRADRAPGRGAAIIDVGGGDSTLVDDLLALGYRDVTVLDVAEAALDRSRERLGEPAGQVKWMAADVTQAELPERGYDVWHDRATFHFLTDTAQRRAYVRRMARALRPGGHAVIATFGPEGPQKCSGLPTMRYDAAGLGHELGPEFRLVRSAMVEHRTPAGARQQFVYCDFVRAG